MIQPMTRVGTPARSLDQLPRLNRGGVMTAVRIFAVVYVIQAGVGIAFGFAYAVWLMYW
jgi:hypothetical protein